MSQCIFAGRRNDLLKLKDKAVDGGGKQMQHPRMLATKTPSPTTLATPEPTSSPIIHPPPTVSV
eukprot:CAMPEP_0201959028 /NCGR_PEP_ID=MMETSP0904-20121228/6073_1 /ASSEMBLY_ACC=CAM_ASM_000553 /TAXON_ID=420261 /ORGANISM="Thalassiosira antarctica, Strain CCMP982" /LENGTH=63 /DNA_ID=CAMNT_0048504557 /DNA_START=962 /DNA_END=1149 /DNA_ORIENTATION=-